MHLLNQLKMNHYLVSMMIRMLMRNLFIHLRQLKVLKISPKFSQKMHFSVLKTFPILNQVNEAPDQVKNKIRNS